MSSVLKTGLNWPVQPVTGGKPGPNITDFLASYELVRTERFSGATNFFCPTDSTGHTYLDSNGVPEWWRSARRRKQIMTVTSRSRWRIGFSVREMERGGGVAGDDGGGGGGGGGN